LRNEFVYILNQLSYIKIRVTHLSSGHSTTTSTMRDGYTQRIRGYWFIQRFISWCFITWKDL